MEKRNIKSIRQENKLSHEKPDYSARIVAILTFLFLLIFFGLMFGKKALIWTVSSIPIEQPVVVSINPIQAVEFKYKWQSINISQRQNLYLDLDITNNNEKPIKSIEIVCIPEYSTGMIYEHKATIFDYILFHDTKHITQYDFGELNDFSEKPKNVNCKITYVTFA